MFGVYMCGGTLWYVCTYGRKVRYVCVFVGGGCDVCARVVGGVVFVCVCVCVCEGEIQVLVKNGGKNGGRELDTSNPQIEIFQIFSGRRLGLISVLFIFYFM